jgi:hypothetical protein
VPYAADRNLKVIMVPTLGDGVIILNEYADADWIFAAQPRRGYATRRWPCTEC